MALQKEQIMSKVSNKEHKLRVFLRWLKEKQIYLRYIRGVSNKFYTSNYGASLQVRDLYDIGNDHFLSTIIDQTMCWSNTQEGYSFWSAKNSSWYKFWRKRNGLN